MQDIDEVSEKIVDNTTNKIIKKNRFLTVNKFLYFLLFCLVGAIIYIIIIMFMSMRKEITEIRETQKNQFTRHVETNQFLLSTIDWSSRRANMILFMRDQIVLEWKRIGYKSSLDEAYIISEVIMQECENYSYIEPFLVLSMQCIESSFRKLIISKMGAKGINQIMSSTGRLLAAYFDYEYTDSLLFSIPVSTRFSVKLMDILYANYNKWELVMADYNGGPYQAYYYKNERNKLSEETKKYVPNVLNQKIKYDSLYSKYRIEEKISKVIHTENVVYNKNKK